MGYENVCNILYTVYTSYLCVSFFEVTDNTQAEHPMNKRGVEEILEDVKKYLVSEINDPLESREKYESAAKEAYQVCVCVCV